MDKIIVTFTDLKNSFFCDLELPCDKAVKILMPDIVELLSAYRHDLQFDVYKTVLLCNRTGKQIIPEDTPEKTGLWNGDYVTIFEG